MIWWRLNDEDDDPVWVFGRQIEQESMFVYMSSVLLEGVWLDILLDSKIKRGVWFLV